MTAAIHATEDLPSRVMLLLVEDNAADADLVDEFLRETAGDSYDLTCVGRVSEAINLLSDAELDVVLLDLGLPDTQGIEGIEAIRSVRKDLPIVVLTGNSNDRLAVECLSAGANDYLMKGEIAPQTLRRSIGYAMARQSLASAREQQQRVELERIDRMRRIAQSMVEANPDAVLVADPSDMIRYANAAAEALFGTERGELVGELLPFPVDLNRVQDVEISRDGTKICGEVHATMVEWEGRQMTLVSIRDLTERRAIEEQLRQAQKMETVGQLTGGVAHDFNNLLTVILGNAEILIDRLDAGSSERELAQTVYSAAERGADLTRKLLAVSRRQALDPAPTDIAVAVSGLESLLQRTLGDDIDIRIFNEPSLPLAMIDRGQLDTALLNLAVNARDAMPNGGTLTIETMTTTLDADYAADHVDVLPGTYIVMSVTDNGIGMADDVAANALDAFFTTKDVGQGTGLGLSMVHGFVKQSGGHIGLYTEVGKGTTVRLYLPLAEEDAVAEPQPAPTAIRAGSEVVLVVEDQDLVRVYVERQLAAMGYRVFTAPDAIAALELLETGQHIDLLFTDVVMPGGMGGRELAVEVARRRPGVRVLFTSGYTENSIVHGGRLDSGVQLLSKPYDRRALAEKVRATLDGSPFVGELDA